MSKDYTRFEDWYLERILDDCNYAIEHKEGLLANPSSETLQSLIMELKDWRSGKLKQRETCKECGFYHPGGTCLDS